MPDVFISYKRQERERVEKLAAALKQLKLDVWFDTELNPGETFLAAIHDALIASRVVLVCWTPEATRSPFVLGEAEHGRGRNALLAAFFEQTDLPPPFNMIQAENLIAWSGAVNAPDSGWRKIIGQIGVRVGRPGLLTYIERCVAANAADLRRWANDNWDDPLSTSAVALAREIEARNANATAIASHEREAGVMPAALKPLGPRAANAWLAHDEGATLVTLGRDLLEGFGVQQDFERARVVFEAAADRGSPVGWMNLGLMHLQGRGVQRDYARARQCFERAANRDVGPALINLGYLYDNGLGVARDYGKARAFYERAAALGEAEGLSNLAVLYGAGRGVQQDWNEARRLFERAAQMGDANALDNLGTIYMRGSGVARNVEFARQCYESAAQKGLVSAIYNLGVMHLEGAAGARDIDAARGCFERAANLDHASAIVNLATMYANGVGVLPNAGKAKELLERAVELGSTSALVNLGLVLSDRTLDLFDPVRARACQQEACDRGNELGCVRLAEMMVTGEGGARDVKTARTTLERCARQTDDLEAATAAKGALQSLR
jgi:TPR repeat protein